MHQPENSAFAWVLESESPTKRRRSTTTHRYIEQDLLQAMEMEIKTKRPWPCDASRSSQQLSQDTPATLPQFSLATEALEIVVQHAKVPLGLSATAHHHGLRAWLLAAFHSRRAVQKRSGVTERLRFLRP